MKTLKLKIKNGMASLLARPVLLFLCLLAACTATAAFISSYPNTDTLQSTDVFIIERPGVTNFNINAAQLPGALGLQSAAFTSSSAYDAAGLAVSVTNGFPWGTLYDAAGAATAATNALGLASGLAAYRSTNTFIALDSDNDAAISGSISAAGFIGSGSDLTSLDASQIMMNTLADARLSSKVLLEFDTKAWTNSSASGITVTNLGDGTATNLVYADKNGTVHRGHFGAGLTWTPGTETLSAPGGGSGTVTSVDVAEQGMTSSGAVTGSGTVTLTRTADVNYLGFGATNMSRAGIDQWQITTNPPTHSLRFTNATYQVGVDLLTNGAVIVNGNAAATTNQLLAVDGTPTSQFAAFDSSGNLTGTNNAAGLTNYIAWTHEGTATNITATFNGSLQSFTVTNGPSSGQDVFIHFGGANGSVSYRFCGALVDTLHFDYQPKWLAGSNNVITNGVLSLTSYGGTNATQIEAAIGENQ